MLKTLLLVAVIILPTMIQAGSEPPKVTDLKKTEVPVIDGISGKDDWSVRRECNSMILVKGPSVRFGCADLPPGLKLDPCTGAISGRPTRAGKYVVRLRAANEGGWCAWTRCEVTVAPLPSKVIGTFNGLVGWNTEESPGLGGKFTLTVLANGCYTGSVMVGSRTYPFTGCLQNIDQDNVIGNSTFYYKMLSLQFRIDPNTGDLTGYVTDSSHSFTLAIDAKKVMPILPGKTPLNWRGRHEVTLRPESFVYDYPIYPQGDGTGVITIYANATYRCTHKLADGVTCIMTGRITEAGNFAMCSRLYRNCGAIQGWQRMEGGDAGLVAGNLEWHKYPCKTAKYAAGFPKHNLQLNEYFSGKN